MTDQNNPTASAPTRKLLEFEPHTGKLRVFTPAGLVIAELELIDAASVASMVLSLSLQAMQGLPVPAVVVMEAPAPKQPEPKIHRV